MGTLREILKTKGSEVLTISPVATVLEAVCRMNEHRVGALVVMERGRVVGIFTERDILRRVVGEQRPPAAIAVAEVMTRNVICCDPSTTVEEAGRLMKDRRVRHVPVCDSAGRLVGMVSIGDLNAYHLRAQEAAIRSLEDYVYSGL